MTAESIARRAVLGDEEEIVRLREQMALDVFGMEAPPADDPLRMASLERVREWLKAGGEARTAVFVVDKPDAAGLAASAIGAVDERLQSERNPSGLSGYVYGVCTDRDYRRRGYSRMAMRALLDWYEDNGIIRVELHASDEGEPLYRGLGFADAGGVPLTRWAQQH